MAELQRNGVRYILVPDDDFTAPDFRDHTPLWGVRLVLAAGHSSLYETE